MPITVTAAQPFLYPVACGGVVHSQKKRILWPGVGPVAIMGLAPEIAGPTPFVLSLDKSWQHHVVMGANGYGVLIGTSGKGHYIFPHVGKGNNLVYIASVCTINRSGLVMILLGKGIHLLNNRLK